LASRRGASWPTRRDSRRIHVGQRTTGHDACCRRQPAKWPNPTHHRGWWRFAATQQRPERACTDRVIEASEFHRFHAGLGFLDGYRCLSKR
jgi:hypothetical protein